MPPESELETRYAGLRALLRTLGPVLIVIGGIFSLIGFIDFFSAFGSFGAPTHFWMLFIGFPLIGIGSWMTRFGYLREAAGYVAGEVTPVGKDVVNYLGEETKDTVADVARAIGQGLAEARGAGEKECPQCHARNEADASFCSACGRAFGGTKRCPACGHGNEAEARFCDRCGQRFP